MKFNTSIFTTALNGLKRLLETYKTLQINQRLYVNSVVTLLFFLFAWIIVGRDLSIGFFYIFATFWLAAIAYDLLLIYKKTYDTVLGKTFLVLLLSLCTNLSITYSNQLVNIITGADPTKFPRTVGLLTILSIPVLASIGFMIIYFILLVSLPLLFWFHIRSDKEKEILFPGYAASNNPPYRLATRIVQFLSIMIFCNLAFDIGFRNSKLYETKLKNIASYFLFTMEMYQRGPYNLRAGTKMAFLGDGIILVGEKSSSGYTFAVQNCKTEQGSH